MIYIVGHIFTYTSRTPMVPTASIQEQITLKRHWQPTIENVGLIPNHQYRIARIYKIDKQVGYVLANVTDPRQEAVLKKFDSTIQGDEFIATVGGTIKELISERESIEQFNSPGI